MSTQTTTNWRSIAACASADPDLFFPEPDATEQQIQAAKLICSMCLVKKACLKDALRRGEAESICGGMTVQERRKLVRAGGEGRVRRPGKASARQLAVKHGVHLMVSLVEWRMDVQQVAESLGSTPMAVYRAYLMLVPPRPGLKRSKQPTVIEEIVHGQRERLKALERRGLSHSEIGALLGVPQSVVSASLAILRQREEGIRRLSRKGADGLERLQNEELRILRQCGAGLSVSDVIVIEGEAILRMYRNGSGMTLRDIAERLGLCRETVRRAYRQMVEQQVEKTLTKRDMEEVA